MKLSRLISEVVTLLTGNVVGQLITLAAYFVVTRLYSPDDFGLFNILFSYVELFTIFSTCKYELAIVPLKSNAEAEAVARFALRLNALVSMLLLLVAALLVWLLGGRLSPLCLLVPPTVFFRGTSRVYIGLLNRMRCYRPIAQSSALTALSTAVCKILFALLGMNRSGLPWGTILGQAAGNVLLRGSVGHKLCGASLPFLDPRPTLRERVAARRSRNFPLFVAPKDFCNSLSATLPVIWLSTCFDHATIGLFVLAFTFTQTPVSMLSVAIESVLYAHSSQKMHKGLPIGGELRSYLLVLAAVGVPLAVVAYIWCEPVFVFCFGAKWAGCAPFVRALLPMALLTLAIGPLTIVANLLSRQSVEFRFFLVLLVVRVIALGVGVLYGRFLLAIWLYSLATAAVYVVLVVWYMVQAHGYDLTTPSVD